MYCCRFAPAALRSSSNLLTNNLSLHSPQKSLSPPRKGNRSGGEGSPLLRHIAAKAYDSYATSEELGAYSSLEVEVEKFWDMIETDLNKVDSFFEGKVAEYHMTLESFYVHESMMGRGSPERKGSSSTNLNGMNRVRKLTLAGSAAPDLRSVKKVRSDDE